MVVALYVKEQPAPAGEIGEEIIPAGNLGYANNLTSTKADI